MNTTTSCSDSSEFGCHRTLDRDQRVVIGVVGDERAFEIIGRTRTQLARVSATPGKTQEINFTRLSVRLRPARMARTHARSRKRFSSSWWTCPDTASRKRRADQRKKWRPLIEGYLGGPHDLRGVVQLIDVRQGPTPDDHRMMQYLSATGIPTLFALTKVDKLKSNERVRQLPAVAASLGVEIDQVVPFSSLSGEGTEDLLSSIADLLRDEDEEEE